MSKLTKEGREKLLKNREPDPAEVAVNFQPPEAEAVVGRVVPTLEIPDPQEPETDDDTLTDAEGKRLEAYEAVLDRHRDVWREDGKCLAGIVTGKLHRKEYPSLEAYLDDRWGISRPEAYRLAELWPLGERLSPMGDRFNQRQARALKPYWKAYGLDAAEAVYRTIVDTGGVKVTARLVEDAVSVLPAEGDYDEATHVGLVQAFLSGALKPAAPALPAPPDPGEQVKKFRAALRGFAVDQLRSVDAAERKELADELRALADQLASE